MRSRAFVADGDPEFADLAYDDVGNDIARRVYGAVAAAGMGLQTADQQGGLLYVLGAAFQDARQSGIVAASKLVDVFRDDARSQQLARRFFIQRLQLQAEAFLQVARRQAG